jgi:serine/threonine protein phosphatase PrpC
MFKGFNSSITGASHIEKDTECQDASLYHCAEGFAAAVVSDGHGSAKHFRSADGSRIAVKITKEAIIELIENNEYTERLLAEHDKTLMQLERNIIYRWNEAVRQHFVENPPEENIFADSEEKEDAERKIRAIYGATLIAAVITEKYWFALQIGDGDCVTVNNDETAAVLIDGDERLVFGFTTSLCDSDANENFRHYFAEIKEERPRGIIISTDGVADSFTPDGFLKFSVKTLNLFISQDNALEELEKFLPELSAKGSKDDVSIAGIYYAD